MGDITREKLDHFQKSHRQMRRYTAAVLAAATLVGCGVGWSLHQTGISATAEAFCGEEEHTHTKTCYEKVLVCGLEEGQTLPTQEPHTHGEGCYEMQTVNVCGEEAHTHSEDCYTLRRDLTCGQEDHTHTDGCYTEVGGDLTCMMDAHTHGEDCLDEEGSLVCTQEEHTHYDGCYAPVQRVLACTRQEHTHSESCYGEPQKVLTCTQKEHTHGDTCFEEQQVLVCTLPEGPQEPQTHTHSDSCYVERLTCGKEEHTHTELCLSDSTADVESPEDWKANSGAPGTGSWAYDLYMVACAQVGYQESQRNFTLDDSGVRQGYTRYGAWYGDPYGSWNGMFVAYCLHFAGVPEDVVPQRAGVSAMLAAMANSDRLMDPTAYTPQPGDIALFGERIGIVAEPGDTMAVICGDVDGKVEEITVTASEVTRVIRIADIFASEGNILTQNTPTGFPEGTFPLEGKIQTGTAKLEKNQNGTWISATAENVTDGDEIRLSFTYTVSRDDIKENGTYQLPSAFKISEEKTGEIFDQSNNVVGRYTINTDGLVTLTYTDTNILNQESFTGVFGCSGSADRSKAGEDGIVSFPGGLELKINPKTSGETDWSVSKDPENPQAGEDGALYMKYNVTVKAGSTAPDGTVTILDTLNNGSEPVIKGSFAEDKEITLVHRNADGTTTTVTLDDTNRKLDNTGDQPTLTIRDLPKLGDGESYQLTYWVKIPQSSFTAVSDGAGKLYNRADGTIGTETKSSVNDRYFTKRLEKTGAYNPETGTIKWNLCLYNPGNKLDGATVKDILPEGVSIVGNAKLYWNYYGTGGTYIGDISSEDLKNGYTFPEGSNQSYYNIEFETTVPSTGTLTNRAQLKPPGEETPFEDKTTVTVDPDKWKFSKRLSYEDGSLIHWSLSADNTTGSSEFTVTDRIKDALNDSGVTAANTHYAIASELAEQLKSLEITWVDSKGNTVAALNASIEIHYYGAQNAEGTAREIQANDTQTPVYSFTITAKSNDPDIFVKSVKLADYTTHWNSDVPGGTNWTYWNYADIGQETVGDKLPYRKTADFEKLVSVNGTDYSQDAQKQLDGKKLSYQIILGIPADYDGSEITVEDVLPDGAAYVENSAVLALDNGCSGTLTVVKTSSGTQFKITDYKGPNKAHSLAIRYSVDISQDPYWKDLSADHNRKVYHNVAKWFERDKTSSADVTVNRKEADDIYKDAVQECSSSGTYSNVVHYTVTINPQKKQLGANSEYLEIWDQVTPNVTGATVEGDLSTVRLYYYHVADGELCLDRPVPTGLYQILDPEGDHWLKMRIPNQEAFVLCYDCYVDPGNKKDVSLNNWVQIEGGNGKNRWMYVNQNSDYALVSYGQLRINKIDSFSGTALPGAEFQIQAYDKKTKQWTSPQSISADASGSVFSLTVGESDSATLKPETLYRIVETKAPENYRLDATPHYVLFYKEERDESGSVTQGESGAFTRATGGESVTYGDETVTESQVTYSRSTGMIQLNIKNTMEKLMVHKNWLDKDNAACDAPVSEIKIQLYRYTGNIQNGQLVDGQEVTLNADNNWEFGWTVGGEGLPERDENRNLYFYYVQEVGTSNIWQVTYGNNRGITSGVITVTNKITVEYSYELPKTGGTGTQNYVFFGAFAMILAGCGMIVTPKKRYTGVNEQ